MFFVAFVKLLCLLNFDVCRIMTIVRLWRLSHYDICRIMMFVVYDIWHIMMFVALWRLSPIMTFVAYRVCRSIVYTVPCTVSGLLSAADPGQDNSL